MFNDKRRDQSMASDAASGAVATVALTGIVLMVTGPDWFTAFFGSSDGGWTLGLALTATTVTLAYFVVVFLFMLLVLTLVAAGEERKRGRSL